MQSPGHQKDPGHQVREIRVGYPMRFEVGDETVAESEDVIRVDEDGFPARFYFPRSAVPAGKLERSDTTSKCPFKGTAHYFHLNAGGRKFTDAVWTYEEPYDEHAQLKDRLAFYVEKIDGSKISAGDTIR